jgi:tRNA threonylcarbamoyladenosine biosynthesis protein TsaE
MTFAYHLSNIDQAAQWLLSQAGGHKVICFHGGMGAGKTTLIHALCRLLKISGAVSSPTFPIINEYALQDGSDSVYHMDLYRLADVEEAARAGVVDALYSGSICLVEWPEKVPSVLPPDALHICIEVVDEQHRRLRLMKK